MFFKLLGASSVFVSYLCVGLATTPKIVHAQTIQDTQNRKTHQTSLLSVKILGEDTLSGLYTVNENGEMTLPLIGTVIIKDQTEPQIESLLTQKYQQGYLIDPVITVRKVNPSHTEKTSEAPPTKNENTQSIYILGGVKSPGRYALPDDADHILKIIALAGGFTGRADAKKFEIMRGEEKIPYSEKTYTPHSGDVIIVKERYFWAGNR